MSTFDGSIIEINGLSVDQFEKHNLNSRIYLLSHCHTDHMHGINSNDLIDRLRNNNYKIYTSEINAVILGNKYARLKGHIQPLNIEESHTLIIPKDSKCEDIFISVTLIPAGHCPGSVMFLFKTSDDSTILYTGDFRIDSKDLPKIKQLKNKNGPISIDKLYFDTTFWDESFPFFPNCEDSCNTICDIVKEWISLGQQYVVNLNPPAYYGFESLFRDMYKKLNMPIHINMNKNEIFDSYRQISEMDGAFTLTTNETQIHSCTAIKGCAMRPLECRETNNELKIRQIRPSARKWSKLKPGEKYFTEKINEFYVCYSSHCSLTELKEFLNYLKPKAIYPCVDPSIIKKNEINLQKQNQFYQSLNSFCTFLKIVCKPQNYSFNMVNSIQPIHKHLVDTNPVKNISITYPDTDGEDESDSLSSNNVKLLDVKSNQYKKRKLE